MTIWKSTTAAYSTIAASTRLSAPITAPISSRNVQVLEANAVTGQSAERTVIGTYAFACWIACPTSWAATAVELIVAAA